MYSPSRNRLTLYETNAAVTHFVLSECVRVNQ
jgi:hypothetical protein